MPNELDTFSEMTIYPGGIREKAMAGGGDQTVSRRLTSRLFSTIVDSILRAGVTHTDLKVPNQPPYGFTIELLKSAPINRWSYRDVLVACLSGRYV